MQHSPCSDCQSDAQWLTSPLHNGLRPRLGHTGHKTLAPGKTRWNRVNVLWYYRIAYFVALFQCWKAVPWQLCSILMAARGCSRDNLGVALYWCCWDRKGAVLGPAGRGEAQGDNPASGARQSYGAWVVTFWGKVGKISKRKTRK